MCCESQAKSENSFNHTRFCVYCIASIELCSGNADHRMINQSVAWLIMQSRLLAMCILATNKA